LLAIHLSALQTLKSGHLPLRHGILALLLDLPGSAQLAATTQNSPTGSSLALFRPARHQTMNRCN
jgi:hypothetical protein